MGELFSVDERTDENVSGMVSVGEGWRGSVGYVGLMVLAWILIIGALIMGVMLLIDDLVGSSVPWLNHAPISAAPLLLIGAGSLVFQVLMRPGWVDFLKAMIVSVAFILWGVDQLLPSGWGATTLADVVIVLYVIDLGWMMAGTLRARRGMLGSRGI